MQAVLMAEQDYIESARVTYAVAAVNIGFSLASLIIAIILVVLAFTFMGTAFDEVLDPKLRKREESETGGRRTMGEPGEVVIAGGAGSGGAAMVYEPGVQTDDAMPDFGKPEPGSIMPPGGGDWVGPDIDDEGGDR